ncbi:MAG: hypothetical protein LAO19_05875 [Acidobacteriia bacterium]|nr:hypothetical protein [Terriglobia bacterium]
MAVLDTITQETEGHADRTGEADLVVALPSCQSREQLDDAVAGLRTVLPELLPNGKTVILHPDTAVAAASEDAGPSAADTSLQLLAVTMAPVERYHQQSLDQGLRALLQAGRTLNAKVCVMMSSEPSAESLRGLADQVLYNGFDLSVPLYARHKFDSLINRGIVYPLTRALYGARLHNPMAADMAISPQLAGKYLQSQPAAGQTDCGWITTNALCSGLQVCQVHRGFAPLPGVSEAVDLSDSLAQVLSTLLLDAERNAVCWQRVRGSQGVRTFGRPEPEENESAPAQVGEMIETFHRGCKDLLDIWATALSPATLLNLKKLAKLPEDQFRLPDGVWVHALYDFMLGHRQRVINREHLLRAMTPIYLAWVASYALEVQTFSPAAVVNRIETLGAAFEDLKPYLLSRWRWPDRFNP